MRSRRTHSRDESVHFYCTNAAHTRHTKHTDASCVATVVAISKQRNVINCKARSISYSDRVPSHRRWSHFGHVYEYSAVGFGGTRCHAIAMQCMAIMCEPLISKEQNSFVSTQVWRTADDTIIIIDDSVLKFEMNKFTGTQNFAIYIVENISYFHKQRKQRVHSTQVDARRRYF